MTIKAGGLSILILATALFVCFLEPSPVAAGTDDNGVEDAKASARLEANSAASEALAVKQEAVGVKKYVRHGSHHWKRHAHRNSSRVALRSSASGKARETDDAADDRSVSTPMPPTVANANAQLASADTPAGAPADTPAGNARAMSARANDILQAAPDQPADAQPAADAPVVATDQLNDVDRTLPASTSSPAMQAMASADAPAIDSGDDSSSLDRTSLIGKIFMAFGGLLTLASAARMFFA